jgi:hypothetical protein
MITATVASHWSKSETTCYVIFCDSSVTLLPGSVSDISQRRKQLSPILQMENIMAPDQETAGF